MDQKQIISQDIHSYLRDNSVPVIASFDSKGNIAPLYLKIGEETYRILSFDHRELHGVQVEFECKISDYNRMKRICLIYFRRYGVWVLKV